MALKWNEKYSVGVKEIDDQHKRFVEIMNSLYAAVYAGENREKMAEILLDLVNYKDNHFETEEKYFDLFQYENADEHKAEHQKLREKVTAFYQQFQEGKADVTAELMDFLEDWLVDHLEKQDQKYVECFKKNDLV